MDLQTLVDRLSEPETLLALTLATLAMAIASLAVIPLLVVKLPHDYFAHQRPGLWERLRTARPAKVCMLLAKNFLGAVLAVLGLAMLVLPGQGLLTLLLAVVMLDLPGKHHLERRLVQMPQVRRALTGLRRRFDQPPFDLPER